MSRVATLSAPERSSPATFAFVKMHGLGNDFVMLDGILEDIAPSKVQLQHLADRRVGVGCDQILIIDRARRADCAFRYRIFNADGGEVEQCGNGVRCVARYLGDRHNLPKSALLESPAGAIRVTRQDQMIAVDMGKPVFEPARIPFNQAEIAERYRLSVDDDVVDVGVVSIGNPHAVMLVDDLNTAAVASLGPRLSEHMDFPRRTNVGFMQLLSRHGLGLRVYERGVGETRACGTGACAAMVVARAWGLVDPIVEVRLPGGSLEIRWPGPDQTITMTGPAEYSFRGQIEL